MVAYAFSTAVTSTTGFTTNCQNSASTTDINTAREAFDWFSTLAGATGNAGGVAIAAITDPLGAAMAKSLGQEARAALANPVKIESYTKSFSDTSTVIKQQIIAQKAIIYPMMAANSLDLDLSTKTALVASYNSVASSTTALLNRLKTLEIEAYKPVASTDVTSTAIVTAMNAVTTATTFPVGSKIFLSSLLDLATLSGAAIPAMPATPFSDSAGLVTAVDTALGLAKTAIDTGGTYAKASLYLNAGKLTAVGVIFDDYCMELGGLMSASSSNYGDAGASKPVYAGKDFGLAVIGDFPSSGITGTVPDFWATT